MVIKKDEKLPFIVSWMYLEIILLSEVTQSCQTPIDLMYCSPPGPSVHGIFQARVLEWVAIAFSLVGNRQLLLMARA